MSVWIEAFELCRSLLPEAGMEPVVMAVMTTS